MEIRSFVAEELGNSSHLLLVPEAGVAVAIDPWRDVAAYLAAAEAEGLEMSWTLDTHVHNDFVSGSREIAAQTGARIGVGAGAGLRFGHEELEDGRVIPLGPYRLTVVGTPGHTPEHVSYLLSDETGSPLSLFSGGALMVGTAARTDLFGPAWSWRLSNALSHSLRERILTLPDRVEVFPTHGGGSFCAAGAAGGRRSTTVGQERRHNRLALAGDDLEFAARALDTGPYPAYYGRMRALNQAGAALLGRQLPAVSALDLAGFDDWRAQGAAIVDLRPAAEFRQGHIPGSLALGADGNVSGWAGWLVPAERPLLLVAGDDAQVEEGLRQLTRIGHDRVVGSLTGGVAAWAAGGRPLAHFDEYPAAQLVERLRSGTNLVTVDVREAAEWHAGHVPGSVNVPVHDIPEAAAAAVPHGVPLAVHCGHDYRATLGASLLEAAGLGPLAVVNDGWSGWEAVLAGASAAAAP